MPQYMYAVVDCHGRFRLAFWDEVIAQCFADEAEWAMAAHSVPVFARVGDALEEVGLH